MKKLILTILFYCLLILILLEIIVRIFHLSKDTPTRFIDTYNVEKWVPNQRGHSVTGNRKQNFSEYRINNSGFNSYREFVPKKDGIEIALVGDSFIEGFHQPYQNSIGKKIEKRISGIEVYEYGYAGYDFADQLHLINAYKEQFDLINHVIIGLKFNNDLTRSSYKIATKRMDLQSPLNLLLKKSKLIVYCKSIGILDSPKEFIESITQLLKPSSIKIIPSNSEQSLTKKGKEKKFLENFKSLVNLYGFDKERFVLLIDTGETSDLFLTYLKDNKFNYIDSHTVFKDSDQSTTLIFDHHWNNHGRTLVAALITNYLNTVLINN